MAMAMNMVTATVAPKTQKRKQLMTSRRGPASGPPKRWAVRLILAGVAAVLGCYCVAFSIANGVVDSHPALAYGLAPYNQRVASEYSMTLADADATRADRARADELAKIALRRDPTAVTAVATLGVNSDIRGEKSSAEHSFAYAQKLSRRDLRTQLWSIENAVNHGKVAVALHQYDITLRVLPYLKDILYPVLASAISDPLIRSELVKTLAAKPQWSESFTDYVAARGPDPKVTATLFVGLRRVGVPISDTARAVVVNALIAARQIDAAWSYYAAMRPDADRRRSRDPRFSAKLVTPSQFDWTAINDDAGLTTTLAGGNFDFSAPASIGGAILQQLQVLPAGAYRLVGHSIDIAQEDGFHPYWTLKCSDGRELGRVDVPNSNVSNGSFSGMFSVPAGCPAQMLLLTVRPSDAVSGSSGQFDRVELVPVR